jgi:PhnB protein
MSSKVKPIPDGYSAITPYLVVEGAARAIDFYKQVFGATERMRMPGPDDRIGHAELVIGGSVVMLADEFKDMGSKGPRAFGGSPISVLIYVNDVDAVVKKAVASGARLTRPVEDKFYGDRSGAIEDPFGHVWLVSTHVEDVSPEEMEKRMAAMAPGQ